MYIYHAFFIHFICWRTFSFSMSWLLGLHLKIYISGMIQASLLLLCFTATVFIINWGLVATMHWRHVCQRHFSNCICSLCVSVTFFGKSHSVSSFLLLFCCGDLWSMMFDDTYNSMKAKDDGWYLCKINYFKIKVYMYIFGYNVTAYLYTV